MCYCQPLVPECQILDGIWDFKDWMKPFLGKIENHSKYHAFKFSKRLSSKAYCIHMFICLFRIYLHFVMFTGAEVFI